MASMVQVRLAAREPVAGRPKAACLEVDPDLFFPDGTRSPAVLKQIDEAKRVCARCPMRLECLQGALDSGEEYGVWGGSSEDERRSHKRAQRRAAARQEVA